MKNLIRNLEKRVARLEKMRSNPRNAGLRQAGTGLKSVQELLPGVTDRQANHFLHALSASILDAEILSRKDNVIKGQIEVEPDTFIHHSSPSYPESERINGVVGMTSKLLLNINLKKLERLAKVDLESFYPSKKSMLNDALTKNIENNILRNMDSEEIDLAFGEVQYEIEQSLPNYANISQIEVIEYDYEVKGIYRDSDKFLTVIVMTKITYDVIAEFDEEEIESNRY